MTTAPRMPAQILTLDEAATLKLSRGEQLEHPTTAAATTMNLQVIGGTLPVSINFVTEWAKPPQTWHFPGFQLSANETMKISYDPSVDPYNLQGNQSLWMTIAPGSWVILTSSLTGGLLGVYQIPVTSQPDPMVIPIGELSLQRMPTNFDAPPDNFDDRNLQRAQQPVVVNFAGDPWSISMGQSPKYIAVHEQYWQLGGVTCSLAPHEVRELNYLRTVGRLDSTTTQDQFQQSLNLSVSGSASWGWGSLSASLSAAFSSSHSVTQTTTITSSATTVVNQRVRNEEATPVTILEWQLVDRFTVMSVGQPPAVAESAQPASVMRLFPPHANVILAPL